MAPVATTLSINFLLANKGVPRQRRKKPIKIIINEKTYDAKAQSLAQGRGDRFLEWAPQDVALEAFLLAIAQMEMESGRKIPLYVDYEETEPVIEVLKGTGNRLLYAAKYLWYADMVCFRETGRSMTGAAYAALPQGPQLNNYRDLVELIKEADESGAEKLTDHEMRILARIAARFPTNKSVYDASHTEEAWKSVSIGRIIPYTEASRIIAL